MSDKPPDVNTVLRDQAFEDIREVSGLTESYARSIGEAAFRGDAVTVFAHMRQLRDCLIAMIRIYNDYIRGKGDGQGVSAGKPAQPDGADQRSGGRVARG